MSLENQVAALVSAANNLTSQVAGKMSEIDQKVDTALQAVPNEVLKQLGKTIFIDQLNGNDSNDGSSDRPIKTFSRAAALSASGSSVYIRLMRDYTFVPGERANFDGVKVLIGRLGENAPKIKFSSLLDTTGQYLEGQNFYALRDTSFTFIDVDLELPDLKENGVKGARTCVISNNSFGDLPLPLGIGLANVTITVPGGANNPFALVRGNCMVFVQTVGVTVPSDWVDAGGFATQFSGSADRVSARVVHTGNSLFPGA